MVKISAKILPVGVAICFLLCFAIFAVRTCGHNIPGLTDGFFLTDERLAGLLTVDLNTASAEELDEIPGIGPALSRSIVSYREKYGKYVDTDELLDLPGMSKELYEQIAQYVSIGGSR